MDPSIMKLLEEDEDESMHSGADVEAFQAALNRDIGGDASISQPSDSNSGIDGNNNSRPMVQWQDASQVENTNFQSQQGLEIARQQEQHSQQMDLQQHGLVAENQQQQQNVSSVTDDHNRHPLQQKQPHDDRQKVQVPEQTSTHIPQTTGIQNPEKNPVQTHEPERMQNQVAESQYSKIQKMSGNQQSTSTEQATNPMNRGKQVPFALLLPALVPHLDKDRAMQLHTLYGKLKKNEIVKDVFVRHMRDIVGDQMLRLAVNKMQSQMGANQFQFQAQASARQQQLRMPSVSAGSTQFGDTHSFGQLNQKVSNSPADPAHVSTSSVQGSPGSSHAIKESSPQKSRELEHQSGSHGIHASQMSSSTPVNQERERSSAAVQGLSKQQQQHIHFPQTPFSMYGSTSGNYPSYSGANANPPASSLKPHPHDPQMRPMMHHQSMVSTPSGGASQAMNMMSVPKFERQNSVNDPGKVQSGSISHFTNNSTLQQKSVPWQASNNKEQSSGPLLSMTYVKPEPVDQATDQQHKLHSSIPQGLSAAQEQGNTVLGTLKDVTFEKQSPGMGFSASANITPSNSVSPSTTQLDPNIPLSSRMPSVATSSGVNAKTPPKKPSVGQKKPLEPPGSSPPLASKKQKVSGAFLDQSIEQLNDVTAVSGVNLREEEEQLFSGSKEDSRVSEASRRVVQEEEERLILQKIPLQKKLAEIMAKCGLKNMSNDVERCLSLCVEERMRGLLCNLIRLSKQRVDAEKTRHRTIVTSDIRQQIMVMNRKAKEEWEKKQAEVEKLRKVNEPEGDSGVDGDKEKDDGRGKSVKVNKEEDDKMRTTAANVAARAAVGGDDMLSKWQLMAEQARQKREGGTDVASGTQAGKDVNQKLTSTSGRNMKDNQEADKRTQTTTTSVAVRKFGRNQAMVSQNKVARTISVKDVIAVLEREPQMSKSTLIYRLYEKIRSDTSAE